MTNQEGNKERKNWCSNVKKCSLKSHCCVFWEVSVLTNSMEVFFGVSCSSLVPTHTCSTNEDTGCLGF